MYSPESAFSNQKEAEFLALQTGVEEVSSPDDPVSLAEIKEFTSSSDYVALIEARDAEAFYSLLSDYITALDQEAMQGLEENGDGDEQNAERFYARLRELVSSDHLLIPEAASPTQKGDMAGQLLGGILRKIESERISTNDLGVAEVLMEEYRADFGNRLHPKSLISAGMVGIWLREMDETQQNTHIIGILKNEFLHLFLGGLLQDPELSFTKEIFLQEQGGGRLVSAARLFEAIRQLIESALPYRYPLQFEYFLHDLAEFAEWAEPGCNSYVLNHALQELYRSINQAADILLGDVEPDDPEYAVYFAQNEDVFLDYAQYLPLFEQLQEEHQEAYLFEPLSKDYIGVHTETGKFAGALAIQDLEAGTLHLYQLAELSLYTAENITSHEDRSEMAYDLRTMLSLAFKRQIEGDLGIAYADLSLREINYLFHVMKWLDLAQIDMLASDIAEFGQPLITALLSTEHGLEMALAVSKIAEYLPHEVAERVFAKYKELVEVADGVREYLQDHYADELAAQPNLEEDLIKNLLQKGRQILVKAAGSLDEAVLLHLLEGARADLLLFTDLFRTLYGQGIALEQFRELNLYHIAGGQLSQEEYDQMHTIADRNWDELRQIMPKMYAQIMHDVPFQLQGKQPKTGEPLDTTWHILKRQDEVLGFFRLDKTAEDTVYFGSMNTSPDAHGSRLGDAIMREMLAQETKGKLVEAHASPKTAICRSYIGRYGFIGTGLLPYYKTGETLLAIERDNRGGDARAYKLQKKSFAELESVSEEEGEVLEYAFPEDFGEPYLQMRQFQAALQAREKLDAKDILLWVEVAEPYCAGNPELEAALRSVRNLAGEADQAELLPLFTQLEAAFDATDRAYARFLDDCRERFGEGKVLTAYVDERVKLYDPQKDRMLTRCRVGFEKRAEQ